MKIYEDYLKELIISIREFAQLMDNLEAKENEDILKRLIGILSKIYTLGVEIPYPNVQEFTVEIDHLAYAKQEILVAFLKLHRVDERIGDIDLGYASLLYDDLTDIYNCLVCAVKAYDEKKPVDEILWYLDEEIKSHSGMHILSVLRQLHRIVFY